MSGGLFGPAPPAGGRRGRDARPVSLVLELRGETDRAWLLCKPGRTTRWIPKSQARRGEGRDENVWTMPAWAAVERGWL